MRYCIMHKNAKDLLISMAETSKITVIAIAYFQGNSYFSIYIFSFLILQSKQVLSNHLSNFPKIIFSRMSTQFSIINKKPVSLCLHLFARYSSTREEINRKSMKFLENMQWQKLSFWKFPSLKSNGLLQFYEWYKSA